MQTQISSPCEKNLLSEISAVENLCSRKSGPKFTKIGDDLLHTNAPYRAEFHRVWSNDVMFEKSVTNFFTHFSILAPHRGPPVSKFTSLDDDVGLYQVAKFRPVLRRTRVRDKLICCQSPSISSSARPTDIQEQ